MRSFFEGLRPFVRLGLGLFVLALLGELATRAAHWLGVPPGLLVVGVMVIVGVVAVLLAAILHEGRELTRLRLRRARSNCDTNRWYSG